jgi:D-aminopeptidase
VENAREEMSPSVSALDVRRRLRDYGINIGYYRTGKHNAITDVPGVKVGHKTIISGEGKLIAGVGPVRTGVTVILPHEGDLFHDRVSAGSFVVNGNGSVTGLDWLAESGVLEGPIALTGSHSVGDVYRGLITSMLKRCPSIGTSEDTYLPVVGECDDSPLSDSHGFHVKPEHVEEAIKEAYASKNGEVAEGSVGSGTGLTCYEFKGGIGTASRLLAKEDGGYTVGVLVNCNQGRRHQLIIDGVPIGRMISDNKATLAREGSIVIVVATNAPLVSRQLNSLSKRAMMGLARTGCTARPTSGEFVIAFSTTRRLERTSEAKVFCLPELADQYLDALYEATIESVQEAIFNALCMATTVIGRDGHISSAMPVKQVVDILKGRKYGETESPNIQRAQSLSNKNLFREIPQDAIKVDLPEVQQPDDYSCGAAMTLSVSLVEGLGLDELELVKKELGTTTEHGTYYGNIVTYLNKIGIEPIVHQQVSKEELKEWLNEKRPVIISMQAYAQDACVYDDPRNNDNGHYIAAVGYDQEDYIYFRDPSLKGRYGFLSFDELAKRWHENEGSTNEEISFRLAIVVKSIESRPLIARHID